MVITDDLVFVHFPKTGGSFVTKVLRNLHNRRPHRRLWDRLYNRWLAGGDNVNYKEEVHEERRKHAPCSYIPPVHRKKNIFSIIRHPFEYYISEFYFGWWRTRSEQYCNVEKVHQRYPHFPEISFEEFVHLSCAEFSHLYNPKLGRKGNPGWYSKRVVKFYFKDPWHTYHEIDDAYLAEQRWSDDMFDVHFLHTNRLNRELYELLSDLGYPESELQFIHEMGKVRPKRQVKDRGDTSVEDVFTPELKEYVRRKDQLIFDMFPEFKNQYP